MKLFICRLWRDCREPLGIAVIFWGVFFLMMFLFCGHAKAHETEYDHRHFAIADKASNSIKGVAGMGKHILPGQTFHLIKPFKHKSGVESWMKISVDNLEAAVKQSRSLKCANRCWSNDISEGDPGAPIGGEKIFFETIGFQER
jgi:hypothetical protein